MNQVTLRVKVTRKDAQQCRVEFFREGHGDDLVDSHADHLEAALYKASRELVEQCGGMITPQNPEGS